MSCTKVQYKRKIIKIQSELKVSRVFSKKGRFFFQGGGAQNFTLAGAKSLQGGKKVQGAPPTPAVEESQVLDEIYRVFNFMLQ